MNYVSRFASDIFRIVLVAPLLVVLPLASCSNSDSIGGLSDGGGAGSGGSFSGAGGAGSGGTKGGTGGSGLGGVTGGVGGGHGGTQTGAGGMGSGGTTSGTGGKSAVGSGGQNGHDAASDAFQCVITNVYCPYGYVLDASSCPTCAPAPSGTGGQVGRDAAGDAYECVITDVYCTYGYVIDAHGCPVCAPTPGGSGGAGGSKSDDAKNLDVQVSSDAQDLAALCTSSGGQITSTSCCTNQGDFPDSCLVGACGCSPASSHTVATCTCPTGSCFSTNTGCGPRSGGSDGGSGKLDAAQDSNVVCGSATCGAGEYCCNAASNLCAPIGYGCIQGGGDAAQDVDSNGCTAEPAGDSLYCGGSKPPHYYGCTMTMLAAPCAPVSIGDMTNSFCCP